MSKEAAKLVVKLVGDNAELRKVFEESSRDGRRFGGDIARNAKVAAAGVAAISTAALVAAAKVHQLSVQNSQMAREIKAQAVTANLTAGAIQEIAYATRAVGVDADKAAGIFKDWQDKLGDFRSTGAGEFADFFEHVGDKVGLTADELARLSGPDALIAVKKAMDDAGVSADRQIFYFESLADDASRLSPLLENNGEKFRHMIERYREMDVAMTHSQMQEFEKYEQDVHDLKIVWDDLTRETVIPFVSAAAQGARWLQELFGTTRTERLAGLKQDLSEVDEKLRLIGESKKTWQGREELLMITARAEGGEDGPSTVGEQIAELKSQRRLLQAEYDELKAVIEKGASGPLIEGYVPPTITPGGGVGPEGASSGVDPLDAKRKMSEAYIAQLDMQFSDEKGRLELQHQQRVLKIEQMTLAETEIRKRGYESLEQLQDDYKARSQDKLNAELAEIEQRENDRVMREFERAQQEWLSKEDLERQAHERCQLMIDNARQRELISEQRFQEASQKNWVQYQKKLVEIELKSQQERFKNYGQLFGGLAGITKAFAGEQSGIYKAMFAVSKAFAVAEAMVSIQAGIAKAASEKWPLNLAAMSSVISATAGIVSTIKGTQMPTYHTGGIAGQMADNFSERLQSGEMLAKVLVGEEVLPETDPRHRNNLRGSVVLGEQSAASNVVAMPAPQVHIHTTEQVRQETDAEGQLHVYVGAAMDELEQRLSTGGNSTSDALEGTYPALKRAAY
ncbi:MAG: hypothetical protein OIF55_14695 [Amphritea sp.]|nr:hypothetical protein [Amphritea sp.]